MMLFIIVLAYQQNLVEKFFGREAKSSEEGRAEPKRLRRAMAHVIGIWASTYSSENDDDCSWGFL